MELEKNKKVLTLKEKQDRAVARLEGLKKQDVYKRQDYVVLPIVLNSLCTNFHNLF